MPNLELLEPIEKLLDESPALFDYKQYFNYPISDQCQILKEDRNFECGTIGCIAGWLTHNHLKQLPKEELDGLYVSDILSQVRELLGISYSAARMLVYCASLYPLHQVSLMTENAVAEAKLRIAVLKLIPAGWHDKGYYTSNSPWELLARFKKISDPVELEQLWLESPSDIQQFCIAVQALEQKFFEDNDIDHNDPDIQLFECPVPHFQSLLDIQTYKESN